MSTETDYFANYDTPPVEVVPVRKHQGKRIIGMAAGMVGLGLAGTLLIPHGSAESAPASSFKKLHKPLELQRSYPEFAGSLYVGNSAGRSQFCGDPANPYRSTEFWVVEPYKYSFVGPGGTDGEADYFLDSGWAVVEDTKNSYKIYRWEPKEVMSGSEPQIAAMAGSVATFTTAELQFGVTDTQHYVRFDAKFDVNPDWHDPKPALHLTVTCVG